MCEVVAGKNIYFLKKKKKKKKKNFKDRRKPGRTFQCNQYTSYYDTQSTLEHLVHNPHISQICKMTKKHNNEANQ